VKITQVQRAHRCRHDKSHGLDRGEVRLTVTEEGRPFNYCGPCGLAMVEEGIRLLQSLRATLMARVRVPATV
jgi:hypothetical protein